MTVKRILAYHEGSDTLFETTEKEFWNIKYGDDSPDSEPINDVTGVKEFEDRYRREKGGSTMAREQAARSSMRDAVRRRTEEQTHGGGGFSVNLPEGVKFFQNDGKTVEFDFVPYRISDPLNPDVIAGRRAVGDLADARFYWLHPSIGPDEKPYICLKTFGQRCPICEAQVQMAKNPKADPEVAKALKSKERVLYNVIDVNDRDGKMMVWDVSYHLFTKKLEAEQRDRDEYYDYADPDNGFSVRVRFTEKSFNRNKFFEADRIDFEKRKPLADADLTAAVDLDACLQKLSYERLEAIFMGVDGEQHVAEPAPPAAERGGRGDRGSRPAEAERGRGHEDRKPPETPAAEPQGRRGRGEDTVHRHDPDAQRAENRVPADEPQVEAGKCPAKGGRFGVDEGALPECDKCAEDTWRACRDDKDRLAREKKAGEKAATRSGGSEDGGRAGRRR